MSARKKGPRPMALTLNIRIEWERSNPDGRRKALLLIERMLGTVVPADKIPTILAMFEAKGESAIHFGTK
jgi:hypothetical protein